MSNIDKRALREVAKNAKELGNISRYTKAMVARLEFKEVATPEVVLALLDEQEVVNELFLRAKALMYQSGGTPIENSLNPIDAWLYDAERAAESGKGDAS